MSQSDKQYQEATFGAGCFWCTEAVFSRIEGVIIVNPGFSGGTTEHPSYKEVTTGNTGHAEIAMITYDPEIVSFAKLLEVFFKIHNPTTLNRQGADIGTQYRSVIFYHDENQKQIAEKVISKLNEAKIWDVPIVTQVEPFSVFYKAEDYHDNYFENNPANPYCQIVITPKVKKFEKAFADILKNDE